MVLGLPARSRLRRGAVPTISVPVSVQPVTKMLVEDAKRSLLKVAHSNVMRNQKSAINDTTEKKATLNSITTMTAIAEQKMAGIDVLLALGLKPAPR